VVLREAKVVGDNHASDHTVRGERGCLFSNAGRVGTAATCVQRATDTTVRAALVAY
jgi:hypothetical protein